MQKRFAIFTMAMLTFAMFANAQDKKPLSPRAKGRKIYGGLVPYGQVWRTGANEATTFVTDTDLTVAGKDVPAGSYTIFTVPNADKWSLIINKKTGEWGIPYKYESDELARVDMKVSKTSSTVENLTISYA